MRTAIIGSRSFHNYHYFLECLERHPAPISSIVSGGAKGADSLAEKYARENNIPITIYNPDYKRFGRSAPLKRNIQILEDCELVLAFTSVSSLTPGTAFTMKEARKRDIAVFHFYPTED
jgi:hypothetical protein